MWQTGARGVKAEEILFGSGGRPPEKSWHNNRELGCCEGDGRDVPVELEEG